MAESKTRDAAMAAFGGAQDAISGFQDEQQFALSAFILEAIDSHWMNLLQSLPPDFDEFDQDEAEEIFLRKADQAYPGWND